ncbi:MAG: stage V sporulation protein AD [Bacilli bacterium]|nr:stage V sporulation protein AD [Bacilli bacterium]
MKKIGKNSIIFDDVYLFSAATVSGPTEKNGPLGGFFDSSYEKLDCGESSWEKAEARLMNDAIRLALFKAGLSEEDLSLIVAGDLNNQLGVSNSVMKDKKVPFLGVYGACSTSVLSLINGSVYIDNGFGNYIACATSSHNATSERQFRYPTEYGGQKPSSLTSTATGAGCGIVSKNKSSIKITAATLGEVYDAECYDSLDMGRTMAPAAAFTLKQHLKDLNVSIDDYDLIITGDLSTYGKKVFDDILLEYDIDVRNRHHDAGCMLYNPNRQTVLAGGSGCACCALVMYGFIVEEMIKKNLNKVLIIATGALHNPIMIAQKESIPAIAHAICLERGAV